MDQRDITPPVPTPNASVPNKYIRTFAGDMETVKQGGVPDLTPLRDATPQERLVEASPVPPAPVPAPPPEAVQSAPEVVPAPAPDEPGAAPLKTYAGDFLDRVGQTEASTATVLAAEQDATPVTVPAPTPAPKTDLAYVIGGVVLLVIGVAGGVFAYLHYRTINAPVTITPTVSAPIAVDERKIVTGTGAPLLQAIEQSVTDPLPAGSARLLYIESTTTPSVFGALNVSAPGILVRNIDPAGSMAGVINVGGVQSPFFILSVLSYGDTFSGMLQWEKTMIHDLSGLYPAYPTPIIPTPAPVATTTATTTAPKAKVAPKAATTTVSAPVVPAFVPAFKDEVISNHDVRIYRDAEGRSVLVYGYWNQTTLVLARDVSAFTQLLSRLAAASTH